MTCVNIPYRIAPSSSHGGADLDKDIKYLVFGAQRYIS